MSTMTEPKKKPQKAKVKRNVVFVTLDDATEAALMKFIISQRIPPDRAAVGYAALCEFLKREGFPVNPSPPK